MTVNVPCEVSVEVAVMLPPVRVLIVAVIADKSVAKNEDEGALAKVVLPVAVRLVTEVEARILLPVTVREVKKADAALSIEAKKFVVLKLVEVAFPRVALEEVRLVIVPEATVKSVMVVVARVVVPTKVLAPAKV